MQNDRFVESSRRVYAGLLKLYPSQHRSEYGDEMLRLFADQCKETGQNQPGLRSAACRAALWMRTLFDLLINAFREHLSDPRARTGLLEAPPNAPLPWKGVALVLLPGLIFFISQVGQLTGADWFYWMIRRGAYGMILPVLAVWIWKRKFPVWGLIPLGLLFKTLADVGYRFQSYLMVPPLNAIVNENSVSNAIRTAIVAGAILSSAFLLWRIHRRDGIPGRAWLWLGVYVVLILSYLVAVGWDYVTMQGMAWRKIFFSTGSETHIEYMFASAYYGVYYQVGFLVLILLGTFFAKRHGRLAALLPVGYLMPSVIFGRVSNDWPGAGSPEFTLMLSVAITALTYRFLVAIAGPVWIVRSATEQHRKQAGAASLLALLAIQAGFNFWYIAISIWPSGRWLFFSSFFTLAQLLLPAAGVLLALALYRQAPAALEADVLELQTSNGQA